MDLHGKIMQGVAIPYSALISLIFVLMLISLPLGPYIMFSLDVGSATSHELPISLPGAAPGGTGVRIELGDVFVMVWAVYAILFAVAMLGPRKSILHAVLPAVTDGKTFSSDSYMVSIIKWFSIIVIVSAGIDAVQEWAGITTEPPPARDDLLRFVDVSSAPLLEEVGFRAVLIGLPLFLMYSYRASARHLLRSLWRPSINLQPGDYRRALLLVAGVGVLFGLAHVLLGEPWTAGKFAQAAAGGTIIGWAYLRHGLLPAIMIHWATNYFIFAYVYFVADTAALPIIEAFSHPMIGTLEILFLAAGAVSILVILMTRYRPMRERTSTDLAQP